MGKTGLRMKQDGYIPPHQQLQSAKRLRQIHIPSLLSRIEVSHFYIYTTVLKELFYLEELLQTREIMK